MRHIFKVRLMKKWWFRWIRNYTWFSFRYWWVNYLIWTALFLLIFWLLSNVLSNYDNCVEDKEINRLLRKIDRELENCCQCSIVETEIDTLSQDDALDSLREEYDACNGDITITLAWNTKDDLDLHLVEPDGNAVYYDRKRSANGAELDIDMNAEIINAENPIENICYHNSPPPGNYRVMVHYFAKKSSLSEIPYTVYVRKGSTKKYFKGVHTTPKDMHLIYEFNYPE